MRRAQPTPISQSLESWKRACDDPADLLLDTLEDCARELKTFELKIRALRRTEPMAARALESRRKSVFEQIGRSCAQARRAGHMPHIVCLDAGPVDAAREIADCGPQDLIYSAGLLDYIDDRSALELIDWIHDNLRPGGRLLLGNLHFTRPGQALVDAQQPAQLRPRSQVQMRRLFGRSKFGRENLRLWFEPELVYMFAEAVRR